MIDFNIRDACYNYLSLNLIINMKKVLTLCMIFDDKKVLLGMKKRGFGSGLWNGFGGKVDPGETIEQAAIRELHEERRVLATKLEKRGIVEFSF